MQHKTINIFMGMCSLLAEYEKCDIQVNVTTNENEQFAFTANHRYQPKPAPHNQPTVVDGVITSTGGKNGV